MREYLYSTIDIHGRHEVIVKCGRLTVRSVVYDCCNKECGRVRYAVSTTSYTAKWENALCKIRNLKNNSNRIVFVIYNRENRKDMVSSVTYARLSQRQLRLPQP
jgi:hypothetical protein